MRRIPARLGRQRSAATACLTAFMVPVTMFGWFTADAAAAVWNGQDRVDVQAAPKAPHQVAGTAGYDPRSLPALPAGDATGPLVPTLSGVVLDGSLGLSTSLTPGLSWPNGPTAGVTFKVTDLAGKVIWSQSVDGNSTRVPPNRLKQGGVYEWSATAGSKTFGPFQVRVDMQRAEVQGMINYGGIDVASVTGEPVATIGTRALQTISGGAAVSLSYRPSNALSVTSTPGVPAQWRLTSSADAPWSRLRRVSATRLELVAANGGVVPFRESSTGNWMADWGKGQAWPTGQYSTVSQSTANGAAGGQFQITDRSGVVTTFPPTAVGSASFPVSTWSAKAPGMRASFSTDGRLTALTDPVSGRAITLDYGGSGKCPTPAVAGLAKAPKGMLCRIHGWDGGLTEILYRPAGKAGTATIGRVISDGQAGGQLLSQTDLAYDAAGRLSAVRSPIANSAVASGVLSAAGVTADRAADPAVLTTLEYDTQGRVQAVRRPAALVPGSATVPERGARTFEYPSAGAVRVSAPGRDTPISESVASPRSMLVASSRDAGGRLQTTKWDASRQAPTEMTQPGGLITRYAYDGQGMLTDSYGPSTTPGSGSAPHTRYAYDTQLPVDAPAGTKSTPITGLRATMWAGADFQGTPSRASVGPTIGGTTPATLAYNWTNPSGTAFAARLEGTLTIPKSGITAITNALPAAQVWIDGERCTSTCPASLDLASRPAGSALPIRIDVRSSAVGSAAVNVQWTPRGGAQTPVPSSALRPDLPQPTKTAVRDQVRSGGALTDLATYTTYAQSDPMQVIAARSSSGLTNKRTYEAYDPASGRFGRATGTSSAAKAASSAEYYARGERAAVSGCGAGTANQGGLVKKRTTPGGLTLTQAYDAAGNVVGQTSTGGSRTCMAYDATGLLTRMTTTGAGTDAQATVTTDYVARADANPLQSRVSFPGTDLGTETTVTDLLGRTVSTTDTWGTTQTTAFNAEDQPVAVTTRTAAGEQTTTNATYRPDGSVEQMSRDGVVLATASYQDSTGVLAQVGLGNGAVVSLSYDSQGNATGRRIEVGGQMLADTATVSPSGRTLGRALSGPDTAASWAYDYDRDGRLTSATLAGTVPTDVRAGTWAYSLDNASRRTRITSPYTTAGGFTYAYSATGALTRTSDPRFAAGFTYDASGRATTAGPTTLTYGASGLATRVDDGTTREDRTLLPDGTTVGVSITTGGTTRTARYSLGGLLLDTGGRITSQLVPLPGAVTVQLPAPASSGTSTWRYADLLGSVAWESTDGEAPTTTAVFDPDGNRLSGVATSADPARPNLAFLGQLTTTGATPVTHMGARDYIAAVGMFLQPDPIPDSGSSAYGYSGADPINASDASGQFFLFDGQWWKENGGAALKVVISVAVAAAVSAVTAGAASGPAMAFVGGVIAGAVGGAGGNALGQVAEDLVNGNPVSVDGNEVLVNAGIGAGVGAISGTVKAVRLVRAGRGGASAESSIASSASQSAGGGQNLVRGSGAAPGRALDVSVSYRTGSLGPTKSLTIGSPSRPLPDVRAARMERLWHNAGPHNNPLGEMLRMKHNPNWTSPYGLMR